ncbi:MAG: hypothetical protein ACE5DM_00670 [Candidatus Nanoarchaeia archaeon]
MDISKECAETPERYFSRKYCLSHLSGPKQIVARIDLSQIRALIWKYGAQKFRGLE